MSGAGLSPGAARGRGVAAVDQALPRTQRVRRRRDFLRIERQGGRGAAETLVVLCRRARPGPGRVGFTVSKKVGNAVVRNRVKRRLRHIARTHKAAFEGFDVVVIARAAAAGASFARLREDFVAALAAAKEARPTPARRRPRRRR